MAVIDLMLKCLRCTIHALDEMQGVEGRNHTPTDHEIVRVQMSSARAFLDGAGDTLDRVRSQLEQLEQFGIGGRRGKK